MSLQGKIVNTALMRSKRFALALGSRSTARQSGVPPSPLVFFPSAKGVQTQGKGPVHQIEHC